MARVKQTVTTKTRKKKYGGNTGFIQCNVCKGEGRIRDWHKKKK